ncbi:hypothetical protein PR048_031825 [Dryococelus australis]|uniref:Uncharacterized protein n=1 Tax=Dryococelus australis TaxID=614101 RepID=A0ABQ9G908_9NEOP|nr:hypothetical protein PR048_031825 [Dryococelus australis]
MTCVSFESTDHFVAACQHILVKSSLKSKNLVKHFRCLQPQERVSLRSTNHIVTIARALPGEFDVDLLCDEWELLKNGKDKEGSIDSCNDVCWEQFLCLKKPSGDAPKYPTVAAMVGTSLALSYDQADVEHRFLLSRQIFVTRQSFRG